MKTKQNIKILIIFILSITCLLILSTKVEAASANIKCEPTTVEIGKPVKITVTGTGVQWNLKLLVDGQQIASNSELENYESNKAISFSGTYTPTTAGTKNVTIQGSVTEYNDGSTITSFKSASITVKETDNSNTGDNNNNNNNDTPTPQEPKKGTISSCKINGITVKKDLKVTNKDSVSVVVNTSTKEGLTIYNNLTKKSYKAKSGETVNVQVVEGTNTLTITLDTGAKATRKIYSQKEEEVEANVIEEPKDKEEVKVTLRSLLVKGVISEEEKIELSYTPEFSAEVFEYQLMLDETLADITKLDIEAIASQEDFTVEITGNEELHDGENTVVITVKSKDGGSVATYKILVTKEARIVPISAPTVAVEPKVVQPLWNRTQKIIITVFTSIIAIMGIVFAVIEYRYKKEEKEETNPNPVPFSEMNPESEDKVGEIPFAKIGFEKEEAEKTDILKEEEENTPEFKAIKEERNEMEEELKKQAKSKKGKHF